MSRIHISGIGVVSPVGIGKAEFFAGLEAGKSGIDELTLFEPVGKCEHAAEVGEFEWKEYCFSKQTYADRCTGFALASARMALEDGGVGLPVPEESEKTGFCFGTMWGCAESMEKFFEPVAQGKGKRASSLVFSHSYPNCPTSFTCIELGLRGYSTSFAGSPLAGLWALRSAFDAVASGACGRVVAGAADALSHIRFSNAEANQTLPATAGLTPPAPGGKGWDLWSRVPGEGAVSLLLESDESLAARGGSSLAVIESILDGGAPDGDKVCLHRADAGSVTALYEIISRVNSIRKDGGAEVALGPEKTGFRVHLAL
ncbi:MAG: hypothetical protein JXR97_06935 [Planctomycetes bacterium]|nr:hypothetical protein [Planctomycetota bacterium]